MGLVRSGVLLLLVAAVSVSAALAQTAAWRVVQASDGTLYLLHDGTKSLLEPITIGDDELAAIPEADPVLGELPQLPERAVIAAQPAAPPQVVIVVATPTPAPPTPTAVPQPAPAAPAPREPVTVSASGLTKNRTIHASAG